MAVSREVTAYNVGELRGVLQKLIPGTVVTIAPGRYEKGIFLGDVHGLPDAPIVIAGADPDNPPIFSGGGEGIKLSRCSYIKLSNLVVEGFSGNGINIDDGGNVQNPSHHILIENITVRNIGPKGNSDALKMSGVDHFVVRNCRFEGWGGSGIDLVGCHHGLIENCQFAGKEGYRTANAIQIKGGSRYILVQNTRFRNAGERVISIGGSTGLQYFRPASFGFEAKDICIAGNTFIGSEAQVAWVTAQDSRVAHNLFYLPGKWVGRILQESKDPQFAPSQKGLFENNLVLTDDRVKTFFNIGRGTNPDSFVFRNNVWFQLGKSSRPSLPTKEKDGVYNLDPMIVISSSGELAANSADHRIKKVGPWSYATWKMDKDFGDINPPPVIVPEAESSFLDRFRM